MLVSLLVGRLPLLAVDCPEGLGGNGDDGTRVEGICLGGDGSALTLVGELCLGDGGGGVTPGIVLLLPGSSLTETTASPGLMGTRANGSVLPWETSPTRWSTWELGSKLVTVGSLGSAGVVGWLKV